MITDCGTKYCVFVYGSLKRGFYNFHRIGIQENQFICEAKVPGTLISLGMYPGAFFSNVDCNEDGAFPCVTISGEILELTQEQFDRICFMEINSGYRMIFLNSIEYIPHWPEHIPEYDSAIAFEYIGRNKEKYKIIPDGIWRKNE